MRKRWRNGVRRHATFVTSVLRWHLSPMNASLQRENHAIIQVVKGIEEAYEEANSEGFNEYSNCTYRLNRLIEQLPDRAWLE